MSITMNKNTFSLSANIYNGLAEGSYYIVTPNVKKVVKEIVDGYLSGVHSFSIIGTYGTGKSSFILNLEQDLLNQGPWKIVNPNAISRKKIEILNIIGDSKSLSDLLIERLNGGIGSDPLQLVKDYYERIKKQNKLLFIAIDEFGKILEHAAKYDPESEVYFFQKFSEYINAPTRDIILVTTLHQNFSAYAGKLSEAQKNEWSKVKGRFQEVVFAEPVEQLLFLAAEQISKESKNIQHRKESIAIHELASKCKFITDTFDKNTAINLFPLDAFSAFALTKAIQRYGQNERSLFSFLNNSGESSIKSFSGAERETYNLAAVYDYVANSFHTYLSEANTDSMGWSSIQISIERAECTSWNCAKDMLSAIKIIKVVGLVNLFGNGGFTFNTDNLEQYSIEALGIDNADYVIHELTRLKIIRFAEYKQRIILFEGTDINLEEEISNARLIVPRPVTIIDDVRKYFDNRVSSARASYYHKGAPRFFEYLLLSEAEDRMPVGDTDGYIELIFSSGKDKINQLKSFSKDCTNAIIFAYFNNIEELTEHIYNIQKYNYILNNVLVDKSDRVAIREISNLIEYEKTILNKVLNNSLYSFGDNVSWFFNGKQISIYSQRDFNKLLSFVCDSIYYLTPVINNELINKHKISASISAAKAKYLQALLEKSDKVDFGFEEDKFPPEKTIYFSLLKDTGLHNNGEFMDRPSSEGILPLWNACEDFLLSSMDKPKKLTELVKILTSKPYKIKEGILEFWIPTYLFIKQQEFSLYGENGQYIPNINSEFFDLLKKHIGDYKIKAYAVDGVKLQLFNQYRKFLNLVEGTDIKKGTFIETIKPFLFFYSKQLNDYAKHTTKFDHRETLRFREVLASAKDPEKAFLEDLPLALGYDDEALSDQDKVQQYCSVIQRSVRELRGCYNQLIDRIEAKLIESLGLKSVDYAEYIIEVHERLSGIKPHILTPRQKDFYQHVMAEFEKRTEWFQSVCYSVLDSPLERIRDDQEEKLIDEMVYLFRECEKQSILAKSINYKIDEAEDEKSLMLEEKINQVLSGDDNLDVYTLMRILQSKMK